MLTYLFIITIAYEFICLIRNIYKYRKRNLTDKEKEILERHNISPETREASFIFSIFCCIGVSKLHIFDLLLHRSHPDVYNRSRVRWRIRDRNGSGVHSL